MAKTEYMAFLMEPEEKRELEQKAFDARLKQGEIIRRALAFYFASEVIVSNQESQDFEETKVAA
jgi:hypothetical protein